MSHKPSLSPSKISTYLACPSRYRWTFVDGRGRWYKRSRSYFSFGTTLHKVLQRFHDSNDLGVATVHQAVAAVEDSWIDAGYSSAQEMQEALGEGKSIIEAYVERVQTSPTTAQTLYFEKLLRLDMGDWDLTGRIDRADEHEDGCLEIIDYKSGRAVVTSEDIAGDLAMGVYQLLLRERHPDAQIRATILALRTGISASHSMSNDELDELKADLKLLGDEILTRDYYEVYPAHKQLCLECEFLQLCRKYSDFNEPVGA